MTKKLSAVILGAAMAFASPQALRAETFTLEEATIEQIQKAMADGALTSADLVSMYLNRIAIYDRGGIKLNALPVLNPKVFDEATAADALRTQGKVLGPLHGVPAAYKDTYHVRGLPSSNGLIGWKNLVAQEDATTVKELKAAGVVTIAKANMDQYSYGSSGYSEAFGQILSPYPNVGDYVGGSSGGSAVSVSANLCAFAMGGDNGGSIRIPASRNSVVGLRGTLGLVSSHGTTPSDPLKDVVGPLARTVGDLSAVMNVVVNDDPNNFLNVALPPLAQRRPADYRTKLGLPLAGKKFGVPQRFIGKETNHPFVAEQSGPQIQARFDQVRASLTALGATVVDVIVPIDAAGNEDAYTFSEPADFLLFDFTTHAADNAAYIRAAGADPVLTMNLAISNALSADAAWVGLMTGQRDGFLANPNLSFNDAPYPTLRAKQNALVDGVQYGQWMLDNQLDALVWPSNLGDYYFDGFMYGSLAGAPVLSVPAGTVDFTTEFGAVYPEGVYFAGRRFDEANLLSYASTFEASFKGRENPSLTPPLPGETIEYSTALPPPSRPELNAPALRVAAGAKVAGKGKKATLVLTGGAVDASGLGSLTVYVNGKKIAAKKAKNWKASVKLAALRSFVKGSAKTVQVTVVAKDVYGNTSVTTKTVKLPKTA